MRQSVTLDWLLFTESFVHETIINLCLSISLSFSPPLLSGVYMDVFILVLKKDSDLNILLFQLKNVLLWGFKDDLRELRLKTKLHEKKKSGAFSPVSDLKKPPCEKIYKLGRIRIIITHFFDTFFMIYAWRNEFIMTFTLGNVQIK